MIKKPHKTFFLVSIILVATSWGVLVYQNVQWVIAYIISINTVTIVLYLYDKTISHTDMMRVPEKILHVLSFCGGSPGALVASALFRHKTQKVNFRLVQWIIVCIQVGILAYISYHHYF